MNIENIIFLQSKNKAIKKPYSYLIKKKL